MCKSFLTLAWFVLFAAVFSVAQAKLTPAQQKITDLEQKWTDAYKNQDIALMNTFLSDDVVVTVEDGAIYGKSGYITHSVDKSVKVTKAEITDVKIRVDGNTAVVTGNYHEVGTYKGKPGEFHDRFTDVWKQSSGDKWLLIASHFSVPVK